MRHTEQEGAGGGEEEVMLAAELATRVYRKSEMMRSRSFDTTFTSMTHITDRTE